MQDALQFVYWLKGYFDLAEPEILTAPVVEVIMGNTTLGQKLGMPAVLTPEQNFVLWLEKQLEGETVALSTLTAEIRKRLQVIVDNHEIASAVQNYQSYFYQGQAFPTFTT